MLDVYLNERRGAPLLCIAPSSFASYWGVLQDFSSATGVSFDFYGDFILNFSQCRMLAELLDSADVFRQELDVKIIRLYALLWRVVAIQGSLMFVGD